MEYSGTLFINTVSDNDIVGIVFGYLSRKKFFVASWKQEDQVYWRSRPFRAQALATFNIKKIHSSSGDLAMLRNVLWHTGNKTNEATLLWKDPKMRGWQYKTAYSWQLVYLPSKRTMRLKLWSKYNQLMIDTGEISDPDILGGRLGFMSFSQEKVIWSAVSARCLDSFRWKMAWIVPLLNMYLHKKVIFKKFHWIDAKASTQTEKLFLPLLDTAHAIFIQRCSCRLT